MSIMAFFERMYKDFNFFLYDTVPSPPPRDTELPSETRFITTIYTFLLKEVVYHGGGGGEYHIRKSWNPYIFFQRNAMMNIKISIIDICYANTALILETLMLSLLRKWKI